MLETGSYIPATRGRYAIPEMIAFAIDHGFTVDPFARYALDRFREDYSADDYPNDALFHLARVAEDWLNNGRKMYVQAANPPAIPPEVRWQWKDGALGLW